MPKWEGMSARLRVEPEAKAPVLPVRGLPVRGFEWRAAQARLNQAAPGRGALQGRPMDSFELPPGDSPTNTFAAPGLR